ncbi:hypothetical protein [Bordetella hinzii]|jgi:hypothetical protein|uniref:Uncharacterized protein n=2 Tax=Bordetella hinzii TaxID=103855 RepID=A0AAN1VHK5_9BORD|nr:hypothetical protein [Bordetella hinzii]AKQ55246.1 hypothetical protein ACR54_01927 [Bordetella hinzii]AKQ59752.1 hypothetical protein ACR55_01884 [Bordetella hinzii]AZW19124.1 hypothetical protein CS347_21360 [Bordetella hinzii]KCB21481.1 hypothetical protein L544_1356 [Bordetella hinzii OH87 BAL007II]KCB28439.1 hypothetical protein L541_1883 [Bordetella hinzii CA90 BAL1384]
MEIISRQTGEFESGLSLETTMDGASFGVYVVLGEPDLDAIADFVPPEALAEGASIHAASVDTVDGAQEQIDEVLENLNPADVVVFFCADADCFAAALDLLGLPVDD